MYKLNYLRDDGKDGIKFYTGKTFFLNLFYVIKINYTSVIMKTRNVVKGHKSKISFLAVISREITPLVALYTPPPIQKSAL